MMDFDSMSREELLEKLKELEKGRAFTYEDRMKLAILDKSPFTVWASDRDCKITLWEGQCAALYGYSREDAIGKDYVALFVAPDEQAAARRDQISIIDNAEIFHNIANDIARTGNTLRLVTNCFRIKDPRTGEYWNAEMGLIIDYLDQEKERLELIVAASRKVKSYTTQFIENVHLKREQFQGRRSALKAEIAKSQQKALGKRIEFKQAVLPIKEAMEQTQGELNLLIDTYLEQMQNCATSNDCDKIRLQFAEEYDDVLLRFEDIVADFEEINIRFSGDNTVLQIRENILKMLSSRQSQLSQNAFLLLERATEDVEEYKQLLGNNTGSEELNKKVERRDTIDALKERIDNYASEALAMVNALPDSIQLESASSEIANKFRSFELKLQLEKDKLDGRVE